MTSGIKLVIVLLGMNNQFAKISCRKFGTGWDIAHVADGALVCTKSGTNLSSVCSDCRSWRLLVWKDGADDMGIDEIRSNTIAGNFYGGLSPCKRGSNWNLCGRWSQGQL